MLQIFNTLTRKVETLTPLAAPKVSIYTCGPTVYNWQHVGNYRTYVYEDCLVRGLKYLGFEPLRVMNITDVGHLTSDADTGEDKLEVGARREGKSAWDIAKFYTEAFLSDIKTLNILPPDVLCRATDHIPEQVALIERLEKKGMTYKTADGIYFDTAKFAPYAKLAGAAHQAGLLAGARVEENPDKRRPSDFAVWKFAAKGEKRQMEWDSPWGRGFPGWHIECSAMAMKYLGETFDIHCGGVDHIPVHHTNEIAQAEGATGKSFVKVWMHGEFLLMNQAKMAKSSGGFLRLQDLQEKGIGPLDYRYFCYTAHYRKQLEFSLEALEAAKAGLRRLRDRAQLLKRETKTAAYSAGLKAYQRRFKVCVGDDLDMSGAVAVVWDALRPGALSPGSQLAMLEEADPVLGLNLFAGADEALSGDLQELLDRRAQARKSKDFATSDKLRQELASKGILVEDTPSGQRWVRRN